MRTYNLNHVFQFVQKNFLLKDKFKSTLIFCTTRNKKIIRLGIRRKDLRVMGRCLILLEKARREKEYDTVLESRMQDVTGWGGSRNCHGL